MYPKKRNLDGVYFRVERDGKWENVCFTSITFKFVRYRRKVKNEEL